MIVAGTGHRPNKLGGYGQEVEERLIHVAVDYLEEIWFNDESFLVISGGALGWDQALAKAAYRLNIPFQMYLPFKDFDVKWPKVSRDSLDFLCRAAEEVKYISEPGYNPYKMQLRNEAMVNAAHFVIALWNGTNGGTANCVRYAEKVGKPIVNLWDKYEEAVRREAS